MSVGRYHGGYGNQAGMTTPATSPWGQQLAARQTLLIDQPQPIGRYVHRRGPYGGTVGGVSVVSASVRPIAAERGYFGDAPAAELQAQVQAPPPWKRL